MGCGASSADVKFLAWRAAMCLLGTLVFVSEYARVKRAADPVFQKGQGCLEGKYD